MVKLPVCKVELSVKTGGGIGMSGGSNEGIEISTGGDGTMGASGATGVNTTGATGTVTVAVGATSVGMSGGSNEGIDIGAVGDGSAGANGAEVPMPVPEPAGGSGATGGDNPKVFWHPHGA